VAHINIASNEARIDLFRPFIEKLGGGYMGVGGIQNFVLASWARSEWIWLIDCSRRIVASNIIHVEMLKQTRNCQEFRYAWSTRGKGCAYKIIEGIPETEFYTHEYLHQTWEMGVDYTTRYFALLDELSEKFFFRTCFNDEAFYAYLQEKARAGRIIVCSGKLEGEKAVQSIAKIAREVPVPITVVYLSNAEEYFQEYPNQFVRNITALPFDERSRILKTISLFPNQYPWAEYSERLSNRGFHYHVMGAISFCKEIADGKKSVFCLLKGARFCEKRGLSVK
jgi:hypothetical protein